LPLLASIHFWKSVLKAYASLRTDIMMQKAAFDEAMLEVLGSNLVRTTKLFL
jgi:hypothetical protein